MTLFSIINIYVTVNQVDATKLMFTIKIISINFSMKKLGHLALLMKKTSRFYFGYLAFLPGNLLF
jgi:hypothetical protein